MGENAVSYCDHCQREVGPKRRFNWGWVVLFAFSLIGSGLAFLTILLSPFSIVFGLVGLLSLIGLFFSLFKFLFFPALVCPICNLPIGTKKQAKVYNPMDKVIIGIIGLLAPPIAPLALVDGILAVKRRLPNRVHSVIALVLGGIGTAELILLIGLIVSNLLR